MTAAFDPEKGPSGRERILWWRATKRERAAKIRALPRYHRGPVIDRLNIDKSMIKRSYSTYSKFDCSVFHISADVMNTAQIRRRAGLLRTPEDRKRHRFIINGLRRARLSDGGPLARLDRSIEGNQPFIYDLHSGYVESDDHLMDAMNAGIEFEMLTIRMLEGKALAILDAETKKQHAGFWSFDIHAADFMKQQPGETVRVQFYFSHSTDLLWFKFRYG